MLAILLFLLKLFLIIVAFAIGVTVLILVPTALYVAPYAIWSGTSKAKHMRLNEKDERLWTSVKNATKLYKAWLMHREPTF